ncbi:MAG TPA: hypothetical protein VGJ72_00055 [Polaromonas sp.]
MKANSTKTPLVKPVGRRQPATPLSNKHTQMKINPPASQREWRSASRRQMATSGPV